MIFDPAIGPQLLKSEDMTELEEAIESRTLFRYERPIEKSHAAQFEKEFSKKFKAPFAIACGNCTQGLKLAILATRPSVGELVFIPAVSFIATAGAVLSCGLIPVLVPTDQNFLLDIKFLPNDSDRVIVVHLDGRICSIPTGPKWVIEDVAQAMGGGINSPNPPGTSSFAAAFSFQHHKVLSSGTGGIVITHSHESWELMKSYHDHGSSRQHQEYPWYDSNSYFGENFIANELTCAVQRQQLRHLLQITKNLENIHTKILSSLGELKDARIIPRRSIDVCTSLRFEFSDPERRNLFLEKIQLMSIPSFTFERYFLPNHPVITNRQSIYKDGFPWNQRKSVLPEYSYDSTWDLIKRTACIKIPLFASQTVIDELIDSLKRCINL